MKREDVFLQKTNRQLPQVESVGYNFPHSDVPVKLDTIYRTPGFKEIHYYFKFRGLTYEINMSHVYDGSYMMSMYSKEYGLAFVLNDKRTNDEFMKTFCENILRIVRRINKTVKVITNINCEFSDISITKDEIDEIREVLTRLTKEDKIVADLDEIRSLSGTKIVKMYKDKAWNSFADDKGVQRCDEIISQAEHFDSKSRMKLVRKRFFRREFRKYLGDSFDIKENKYGLELSLN